MAQGRIEGRVAVVTGGASGIGKATAELFAQEGAKVVIGDLQASAGEEIAKSIGGTFIATDVGDPKAVERLVRAACDKFGGLDIMFNNAGIGIVAPLVDTTEEIYAKTIRIDLDGVYWGLKFAGRSWSRKSAGRSSTPRRWPKSAAASGCRRIMRLSMGWSG
jgi:NAD(P)-dependent dehydrogenase (short-subunit alcohol dehydrogenase family)